MKLVLNMLSHKYISQRESQSDICHIRPSLVIYKGVRMTGLSTPAAIISSMNLTLQLTICASTDYMFLCFWHKCITQLTPPPAVYYIVSTDSLRTTLHITRISGLVIAIILKLFWYKVVINKVEYCQNTLS